MGAENLITYAIRQRGSRQNRADRLAKITHRPVPLVASPPNARSVGAIRPAGTEADRAGEAVS